MTIFYNISSVGAVVGIVLAVLWMLTKKDRTKTSKPKPVASVNYDQLPPLYKIKMLTKKLDDLKRIHLNYDQSMMSQVDNTLATLRRCQMKADLQLKEQLTACTKTIMWLEETEAFRKKCDPPMMYDPFAPLLDSDLILATKLTSLPINLSRGPKRRRRRNATRKYRKHKPSIPKVDEWMWDMVWSLTRSLDIVWDVVNYICIDLEYVDYSKLRGMFEFLYHIVVVTTEVDLATNNTKITIDFKLPGWDPWYEVPRPPSPVQPRRPLCCTPVRYKPTSSK